MATLEIIGIPQSTFTRAARIAAHEKGVDYSLTPDMPHTETVNRISPPGRVPVMRHGDVELCESRAIMGYIDDNFDGPALMPSDPVKRARAEEWVSLTNTYLDKTMIRDYLFAYLFPNTDDKSPDREKIDAAMPELKTQVAALDKALAASPFLAGDDLSIADINLMPIFGYVRDMPDAKPLFDAAPNLAAYVDRLCERQSFKDTVPPQPDA